MEMYACAVNLKFVKDMYNTIMGVMGWVWPIHKTLDSL